MDAIKKEIAKRELDCFAAGVERDYLQQFIQQYSKFSKMKEFLMPREVIRQHYIDF